MHACIRVWATINECVYMCLCIIVSMCVRSACTYANIRDMIDYCLNKRACTCVFNIRIDACACKHYHNYICVCMVYTSLNIRAQVYKNDALLPANTCLLCRSTRIHALLHMEAVLHIRTYMYTLMLASTDINT